MSRFFSILSLVLCFSAGSHIIEAASLPEGKIVSDVVSAMYQGGEKLRYSVSWTGGIKIGELQMEVAKVAGKENVFELRATVKDSGLFHFFYPVNDSFTTRVEGEKRLPLSYEVVQKEGRSYEATRHTEYDQKTGLIRYQKNEQDPVSYKVDGEVHNEFSSFFFTRLLHLDPDQPVIVPTFADGKRHEVVVRTGEEIRIRQTIRGDVNVLPVTPVMKFKGLYDKDGDTVIWLTNDQCRIPVRINSKILIGSLTAELVSYANPFCQDQSEYYSKIPEGVTQQQEIGLGD
jgi:Protein of unknown function (DUF3108)